VTPRESDFVEEMGQFLASVGMTRMAGRMWGWLLICDPPEQTAADLAEALQASRGAISGTARLLTTSGLIRRSTRGGERREYFSVPPGGLQTMLANAGALYRRLGEIAEHGLAATDNHSPASRARLEEFRDVMAFVETEVPRLVTRFLAERAAEPTPEQGSSPTPPVTTRPAQRPAKGAST
jgi:hypothetical protein